MIYLLGIKQHSIMDRLSFSSYLFALSAALLLISGCASRVSIENEPIALDNSGNSYSILSALAEKDRKEVSLILTFSGGGTRAAALSYGVLKELRDTVVTLNGQQYRLIDLVDVISSVSGGSFTSAYYGLFGDELFSDFEDAFLKKDINASLIKRIVRPVYWFSSSGRTDRAAQFYDEHLFHGATFSDILGRNGPLILINASDLSNGVRFSFIQEYFDLLCSDIRTYPVSKAVTASSAVPILFSPVVLENYQHCKSEKPDWLRRNMALAEENPDYANVLDGLSNYFSSEQKYSHLVDGGITDNLGLRSLFEIIELSGGMQEFFRKTGNLTPRQIVIISVDASTSLNYDMDQSSTPPSINEMVSAISKIQISRYNAATAELMANSLDRWVEELSKHGHAVRPYFVQVKIDGDYLSESELQYVDDIPTSFSLSSKQVDALVQAAQTLLKNNPSFEDFIKTTE